MKKAFSLLFLLWLALAVSAQQSWNLVLHKKTILTGKEVNEDKNVKLIRSADWKKSGYLEVRFREEPASNWIHSFFFQDEQGNDLLRRDSTLTVKISTTLLRKSFAGKKQVKIYMVIAPSDPMIMAPARRIHLATLKLP